MNPHKKYIIETLAAKSGTLYLAYAEEKGRWVWVGYVGQGQYDYSLINEAEMISTIKEMVDSSMLVPMARKPASIPGISFVFYKLASS